MHDSQLQSFLTAARYGSFNSAAKEEHLAVQSFVHRINSLEHELGFSLFSRTTKGIVLTPAGEEFLGTAQEMLNLLKAGKTRALKTADQLHETIRIGVPWRVFPLLQALYVDYQEQYPEVSIECLETSHENLFADLSQKAFDVAFFPYSLTTLEDGIESQCLASVKSVCVFQKNSDLAELETIDPVDLIGKKVLFGFDYHSSPGFQFLENWPAGVDMIPGMFPGEEVVLKCLSDKNIVALFSQDTAPLVCPPLIERPINGCPPFPVGAYYSSDASQTILDFIDYVAKRYDGFEQD